MSALTMRFSNDYSSAVTADGNEIKFTRLEAKSLMHFAKNPGRLVTRTQLLNAVSFEGSDKNDRNIDFLVNRIRKKLSDSAKDPRFIATRYGEGYIWLGSNQNILLKNSDTHFVIGPILFANQSLDIRQQAATFCRCLQKALKPHFAEDQKIVIDLDCPPASSFGETSPELNVELTFFVDFDVLECIANLKNFRSGKILAMTRLAVDQPQKSIAVNNCTSLAEWIQKEVWQSRSNIEHSGAPLPVAVQTASQTANGPSDVQLWRKNDIWISKFAAEHPDDPDIQLKYATHLHTKYIVTGHELFKKGVDNRKEDEDKIEQIVHKALPHVQSNAEQAIMVAKLLFFIDRGYSNFAIDLAESASKKSTFITHSLPIIGQLRGFTGNFDYGIEALNQSIHLAQKNTSTHLYALVIKCSLLLAAGETQQLEATKNEIYSLRPAIKFFLEPLFSSLDPPSLSARAAVMMLSRKSATARLLHYNYVSSRLFQNLEHRENSIRTLLSLMIKRFDENVVPAEISSAYPNLISQLTKR